MINVGMKIKYIISIVLIALCFAFGGLWKSAVNENYRLHTNQRVLIEDARYYRTRDSLSAASVGQLTLRHSELELYCDDLISMAFELELKVRRLETASRTATNTVIEFVPLWRDSVVFREGRVDTLRCATFSDTWVDFEVCDSSAYVSIADTLVQFVHRMPRRWWFIKFGTKSIRQEVMCRNPHTEIIYTEYINFVK